MKNTLIKYKEEIVKEGILMLTEWKTWDQIRDVLEDKDKLELLKFMLVVDSPLVFQMDIPDLEFLKESAGEINTLLAVKHQGEYISFYITQRVRNTRYSRHFDLQNLDKRGRLINITDVSPFTTLINRDNNEKPSKTGITGILVDTATRLAYGDVHNEDKKVTTDDDTSGFQFFNTFHELQLLDQLKQLVRENANKKKVKEVKEQLVTYLIRTLACFDFNNPIPKEDIKYLLKDENIELLKFLCVVETPKIKRGFQPWVEEKEGGRHRVVWLTIAEGYMDDLQKTFGVCIKESPDYKEDEFFKALESYNNTDDED